SRTLSTAASRSRPIGCCCWSRAVYSACHSAVTSSYRSANTRSRILTPARPLRTPGNFVPCDDLSQRQILEACYPACRGPGQAPESFNHRAGIVSKSLNRATRVDVTEREWFGVIAGWGDRKSVV